MIVRLQPLRVPTGWQIVWNTLFEEDPTTSTIASGYYFGGTDLFLATHSAWRRAIDIEWRTDTEQPSIGRYLMRVHSMVEDESFGHGRSSGLAVNCDSLIHEFETVSRLELVTDLEAWLSGKRSTGKE